MKFMSWEVRSVGKALPNCRIVRMGFDREDGMLGIVARSGAPCWPWFIAKVKERHRRSTVMEIALANDMAPEPRRMSAWPSMTWL